MSGEAPGFDAWYAGEHDGLVRAVWAMTGDREVAADVTAEAFSRALERWDRVSVMASPAGWVRQVAVNLARRRYRRARLERLRVWRESAEVVDQHRDIDLWRAVAALPPREREAIALRYLAGLSEAAVAEAMGVRVGTASATLAVARRRLASQLGTWEGADHAP